MSKVIQNIANGVKFGAKEHYMTPVNDFLDQYTPSLNRFLTLLKTLPSPYKEVSITVPAAMIEEAMVRLMALFEMCLAKVEEVLRNATATEPITHSMSDNVALVLRDFPKRGVDQDKTLNDFALLARFEDLLLSENCAVLAKLLAVVSTSTKEVDLTAKSALQILAPRQGSLSFISIMIARELEGVSSLSVVTDSLPLSFRLAASYLHSFGGPYLKRTLQELVLDTCTSRAGFEVDPQYLPIGENLQKNMDNLVLTAYKLVSAIIASISFCPG